MCYSVYCTKTAVHLWSTNFDKKRGVMMESDTVGHTQGQGSEMILVDSGVLPETYLKVLNAKRLLRMEDNLSASEVCARVGISRSAFYKYKDHVFEYSEPSGRIVTVSAVLQDKPGILSKMISTLYDCGANIMTVNQNIPSGGRAAVSVSFRTGKLKMSMGQLLKTIKELDGVRAIQQIADE